METFHFNCHPSITRLDHKQEKLPRCLSCIQLAFLLAWLELLSLGKLSACSIFLHAKFLMEDHPAAFHECSTWTSPLKPHDHLSTVNECHMIDLRERKTSHIPYNALSDRQTSHTSLTDQRKYIQSKDSTRAVIELEKISQLRTARTKLRR